MRISNEFITYKVVSYLTIFLTFNLMNNQSLLGFENELYSSKSERQDNQFEKAYFQKSLPFSKYDNLGNQMKVYFGYSIIESGSFYPDSFINNNSDSIRDVYKSKLNDMTIIKFNYNIEKDSILKD